MNSRAVKLALLKMNSEDLKSPRTMLNNEHSVVHNISKKSSAPSKNQFIISNTSKMNQINNNYKLKLSNTHLEAKKVISQRSDSRNNKLSSNLTNSTLTRNSNFKSNTTCNYVPSITSPANNISHSSKLSNDFNFRTSHIRGMFSPSNINKYNVVNKEVHDKSSKNSEKSRISNTPKLSHNLHLNNSNINTNNTKTSDSIDIMSLLSNQNYVPLSPTTLKSNFPNYEATKCSTKPINFIKGYAANTSQGLVRNYNEDRVSIILNISKPPTYFGNSWPRCSFFAVYDGHGGSLCAEFLRDNLHDYIVNDKFFPENPTEAIKNGFMNAEKDFIHNFALSKDGIVLDRSGSCAVVTLIVDDMMYFANVGDSRAILSKNHGENVIPVTVDHKPSDLDEQKRISLAGGRVYQTQVPSSSLNTINLDSIPNKNQLLLGPYRIFPGRLSVSRSFGDVEAKLPQFGGMEGVLIASPEVFTMKISEDLDFAVIGCDGIFDQLSNKEVVESIWMTTKEKSNFSNHCCMAVDMVMKSSLVRKTLDNITVVFIAFENFERFFSKNSFSVQVDQEKTSKENLERQSVSQKSNTQKIVLQEKNMPEENEPNVENNEKIGNEEDINKEKKLQCSMKTVRIASSNLSKNHSKTLPKTIHNLPKKLPFLDSKKFFYINPKQNKINENQEKMSHFKLDKMNFSDENKNFLKHLTIESVPTTKARNVKTLSEFLQNQQHAQNLYKSNNEESKNKLNQIEISKLIHTERIAKKF